MRFAGTITTPEDAFEKVVESAARSFKQHGFRHIVLLGDHGSTQAGQKAVAARLNREWPATPVRVLAIEEYYRASEVEVAQLYRSRGYRDAELGRHAGLTDTALTLATAPALVRARRLRAPPGARAGPGRSRSAPARDGGRRGGRRPEPGHRGAGTGGSRPDRDADGGRHPQIHLDALKERIGMRTERRLSALALALGLWSGVAAAQSGPVETIPGMPPVADSSNLYRETRPVRPVGGGAPRRISVPNRQGNDVWVIDPATMKVVDKFPVGVNPQHVVPAWDLKTLWVTNNAEGRTDGTLTPIDPTTGKPGKAIAVDDPYNMYFTPDGRSAIVVAEALKRLDLRDPQTMALQGSIAVPQCKGIN